MIDILCVGTGRDGTVTMTNLINQIFDYEKRKRICGHEIFSRVIYNRLYEIGYDDLFLDDEMACLIEHCKFSSIVGAGYSVFLERFAKIYPHCKLIHLKRKNKQAFIESYSTMVSQFPHLVGGYSDIDEAHVTSHIMTACDFKVMSKADWDLLPTAEKISWYYEKTHQLIETQKRFFADNIMIYTEDLNEEKTRKELAKYVLNTSETDFIPRLTHLNTNLFQNYHFTPNEKSLLHWWFHDLNPHDILRNDSYILDFILNKHTALMGYHDGQKIEELFGLDSNSKEQIIRNFDKAISVLQIHTGFLTKIKNGIEFDYKKIKKFSDQSLSSEENFGIKIIEATYGWNCRGQEGVIVNSGNVTAKFRNKCDGKERVEFKIDVKEIGDPAPGLAKDLTITWRYTEDPKMIPHHFYIPAEAHGESIAILDFYLENKSREMNEND